MQAIAECNRNFLFVSNFLLFIYFILFYFILFIYLFIFFFNLEFVVESPWFSNNRLGIDTHTNKLNAKGSFICLFF